MKMVVVDLVPLSPVSIHFSVRVSLSLFISLPQQRRRRPPQLRHRRLRRRQRSRLKQMDLKHFILSPFYHMDESHLVFNMMSLLWKGIQLETSMGSVEFASMVATLLALSQGVTLLLAKSLFLFFDYGRPYYFEYFVGFSGVLFAMKVVLNSQSENYTNVYGLIVHARYTAWAELILIQMFVPRMSFLGHLDGIMAGILYLRLKRSYPGPDPLTTHIRGLTGVLNWPVKFACRLIQQPRLSGRGRISGGNRKGRTFPISGWRCLACTYDNFEWLNVCKMCGTGTENRNVGLTSSSIQSSNRFGNNLSLEELRLRRIERLVDESSFMMKWWWVIV